MANDSGKYSHFSGIDTPLIAQGAARVIAPDSATFSPAAGGSNVCLVTITVKDGAGVAMTRPIELDVWLSDAATGIGLTATTASGAVAAGATGTDMAILSTKKMLRVLTSDAGVYILSITDTAKTGFYVTCFVPGSNRLQISSQLITANYG